MTIEEFNTAFHKFYKPLCFFAQGMVVNRDVAEDIVQDAFVAAYRKLSETKPTTIKAYLYITVSSRSKNHLRHVKIKREREDEIVYLQKIKMSQITTLDRMIHSELMSLVLSKIESIPPGRKKVFKMAYIDGLTNSEIVDKLKLSISTVKEHKWFGLKYMRKIFANLKIQDNV